MKILCTLVLILGFSLINNKAAYAEETMGEKAAVKARDMKRATKKGINRTKEALCMKDDIECESRKLKNRGSEVKEAAEDKATELKNKID